MDGIWKCRLQLNRVDAVHAPSSYSSLGMVFKSSPVREKEENQKRIVSQVLSKATHSVWVSALFLETEVEAIVRMQVEATTEFEHDIGDAAWY